jgi:predicted permease
MDSMLRDLRFAVRGLLRTPGFTAAAVLALALGIGATTAIFSVVHAVLMRSLGWGEQSRLVAVRCNFDAQNLHGIVISAAEYEDLRVAPFFETVGAMANSTAALQGEQAERVKAGYATGSFFEALGVHPIHGRVFTEAEDHKGNNGSVVVSWSTFRKRFGGDPSLVGRLLTINGLPRTVVGVLPETFRWDAPNEFWLPFGWSADELQNQRGNRSYDAVARLKGGLAADAAGRQLEAFSSVIAAAHPDSYPPQARWHLSLEMLRDRFVGPSREPLLILFGAVLLVLLIACANVANLLLARGAARSRELAVRSAMGAGRSRLVLQLLTESALLAVVGAAAGVGVASWSLDALLAAAPDAVRQLADVRVSRAVLGFAALLTVATTLVFGLAPSLSASRTDLAEALKDGSHGTAGPRAGRLRSALIVGQVALSLMLLVAAGLLLRSFSNLLRVDAGFDPRNVLAAKISLSGAAYEEAGPQARFWTEAVRRAAALPGVESAGAVNMPPLGGHTDWSYAIDDRMPAAGEVSPDDEFRRATDGYFHALRIPILRGRDFTAADDAKAPLVLVVNDAWVRRFFPGQEVIGKVVHMGDKRGKARSIVGVVADVHDLGLDRPPVPMLWAPEAQMPDNEMALMVRTAGPAAALAGSLRQQLASIDPAQPIDWVEPFESRVESALAPRRFPLQLLGAFAALALLLSAVGIYGVTAYGVAQRTREIGLRIAIGAQAGDVLRMVMGGALRLAVVGVVLGLGAALAMAGAISSLLYGVSARDPLTYLAISATLVGVALFASFLPAHRATRVDPMTALRTD